MSAEERAASLWLRFAQRCIPEHVRADPAGYRLARTALGIFVATAPVGLGFGTIHWLTLPPPIASVVGPTILGCALAGALSPLLLRRFGAAFATQVLLAYCFAALTVLIFCLGGPDSSQLYWLIAIPVPAILAFGGRGAWWLVAAIGESLVLYALHRAGFQFPHYLDPELARAKWVTTAVGFTIYFAVQFWVFASVQANATAALRSASAQLERTRTQAESANRAKSSFIANVSHKLRTPMTAVLGYTELLHMNGAAELGPESLGLVGTIERNGHHLLAIVDDVLDLSKLEAGQIDLQPAPVTLRELLSDVTALMGGRARARGLELTTECAPDVPARIETDPKRLRQILFNLLGNAIKFTPAGRVTLQVTRVPERGGRVRFTVSDTGIGLTPEQLARLFQPFSQADASTTRLYGGTGLGLSICKRFVERMGGSISVESTAGQGSSFAVELPAIEPSDSQRPADELTLTYGAAATGRRVILADADSDHRELLREVLLAAGAEVEAREDAAAALDEARAAERAGRAYDVALVDVSLALLRDDSALRELAARAGGTRVVALSAGAYREDRELCLASGFDAYVTKPVNVAELIASLSRATVRAQSLATARAPAAGPVVSASAAAPALPESWLDARLFPDETLARDPLRRTKAHALLGLAYAAVAGLASVTGGAQSALGYWLFAIPMISVALVGARGAVVWASLSIAQFAAFFALARHGVVFPNSLTGEAHIAASVASFVAMALLTVGFAHRYSRHTNRTLDRLAAANADLVRARDSAERAISSKAEFLASISHEIRTPMTAILGFAEVLAEAPSQARGERSARALAAIRRNGARLLQTVDDLLDLSKIEARRLHVERIAVSPQALVRDVLESLRPRAHASGLSLEPLAETPIPSHIASDGTRLRKVVWILVENALRFTRSGGVIVVSRLLDRGGDPKLEIEVRDSGVGMSGYDLARIRTVLAADVAAPDATHEVGLGLIVCGRLTALLGGTIEVESELGQGSQFRVALPTGPLDEVALLASDEREPREDSHAESLEGGVIPPETRVLLADDGADNRRLIALLLRRAGAEVTLAANGDEALILARAAELEERPIHVVLMDMHMPVVDGYEATRRLRARGYTGPIVALTAQNLEEARAECLAAGCDDFLSKPVDRARLIATVARLTTTK